MCRSHSKSGDSIGESDNENKDYIPLVGSRSIHANAQSACMFFLMDTNLNRLFRVCLKRRMCHKLLRQLRGNNNSRSSELF